MNLSNTNEPNSGCNKNKYKKKNNHKITPLSDTEITALADELRADYTADSDAESGAVTSNATTSGAPIHNATTASKYRTVTSLDASFIPLITPTGPTSVTNGPRFGPDTEPAGF